SCPGDSKRCACLKAATKNSLGHPGSFKGRTWSWLLPARHLRVEPVVDRRNVDSVEAARLGVAVEKAPVRSAFVGRGFIRGAMGIDRQHLGRVLVRLLAERGCLVDGGDIGMVTGGKRAGVEIGRAH